MKQITSPSLGFLDTRYLKDLTDVIKDTHIDWGTGATQVSAVDLPIADAGSIITATEVETALQENRTAIDLNTSHASSDGTDHTYIDQDLQVSASPTFVGLTLSGAISGITTLGMAGTAPYFTLQNTTHEDIDYGRESRLIFKGEQSGGEVTTLGEIEFAHDGTADDQKGIMTIKVNDGNDGTSPTDRVTVLANGNVGIGTTGPLYKLDVNGGSTASQLHFSSSGLDSGGYIVSAGANNFFTSAGASWNGSAWVAKSTYASIIGGSGAANGDLAFYTDSGLTAGNTFTPSNRMVILNNGKVGIGVTDPDTKLEVFGSTGLKISFDATDNTTLVTDTSGELTVTPSGGIVNMAVTSEFNIFKTGENPYLNLMGSVGGNDRYVSWQVEDTTDTLMLTRDNVAITKYDIRMPVDVGDGTNYSSFETDGSLKFTGTATVWNDLPTPFDFAKVPASNAPTWASFLGNLNAYTFAVGDYLEITTEVLHGYKEDSDIELHVHWATNGLEGAIKGVKWEIEYTIANSDIGDGVGDAFPAPTVISVETAIPANTPDRTHMYTSVVTITGTDFNIGSIIKARVRRIASVINAAPVANPFGMNLGCHYENDTVGSRTLATK